MSKLIITILVCLIQSFIFPQENTSLRRFISYEIKEWDNAYGQELLILETQNINNFVLNDTLIKLSETLIANSHIDLYEYKCKLLPSIYDDKKERDFLSFYVLKSNGKFYRLFGFSKCDFEKFILELSVNKKEVFKFLKSAFEGVNKKSTIKLNKAVNKNQSSFYCKNTILEEFNILYYTTVILPVGNAPFGNVSNSHRYYQIKEVTNFQKTPK